MAYQIYEAYQNTQYNDDGSWYDWDSSVADASNYLYLYGRGCNTPTGINCTTTCLDTDVGPNLTWNNTNATYTLHNCMVLPFVAYLLANGNLTAKSVTIAERYGIPADASLISSNNTGWPVINNCVNTYCNTTGTPGCSPNAGMYSAFNIYTNYSEYDRWWNSDTVVPGVNISLPVGFNTGICWGLNAVINPDIGGIGMFVSYIMQTAIIVFAWLAFHFYNTWAEYPMILTLLPFKGARRASDLAGELQRRVAASHHSAALVIALGEFQTAQVFFMLAVQVASIIAIKNPTYIQASSWQQLWNNIGILWNVSMAGCIPVVFAAVVLRVAGKREVFPLITTTICISISAAVWFYNYYAPINESDIAYTGQPIDACGGNVVPIKFCYAYDWYATNADATTKGIPMVLFSLVVQICLILDQCRLFSGHDDFTGAKIKVDIFTKARQTILNQTRFWDAYEKRMSRRPIWARLHLDTGERVVKAVIGGIILATECVCCALNIVLITDYARILPRDPGDPVALDLTAWSLGQVISVAIWIPVLLEYIWLAIMGIEEGMEHRVPGDYKIVPKDDDSSTNFKKDHGDVDVLSSAIDLTPLEPAGKPGGTEQRLGYQRMNSNNWMQ